MTVSEDVGDVGELSLPSFEFGFSVPMSGLCRIATVPGVRCTLLRSVQQCPQRAAIPAKKYSAYKTIG
jgi:hypothetical protein